MRGLVVSCTLPAVVLGSTSKQSLAIFVTRSGKEDQIPKSD